MQHFHVEHLDPWYVTGLCDGRSDFTFSRNKGTVAALYFAMKANSLDRGILELVQGFFYGAGHIYDVKPRRPRANSGWSKAAVYYRVTKLEELKLVVEHFDDFPFQGRRREVFSVWRSLYEMSLRHRGRKLPPEEKRVHDALLERLSSLSPRNQQWKDATAQILVTRK